MSETYSCLFLFDIELKFIEEDIIFILKGFTSCFFFCECDESKTSSRSSGVTQVHSYMFHLTEFTKKGLVNPSVVNSHDKRRSVFRVVRSLPIELPENVTNILLGHCYW